MTFLDTSQNVSMSYFFLKALLMCQYADKLLFQTDDD
jgi:hypothetical protein